MSGETKQLSSRKGKGLKATRREAAATPQKKKARKSHAHKNRSPAPGVDSNDEDNSNLIERVVHPEQAFDPASDGVEEDASADEEVLGSMMGEDCGSANPRPPAQAAHPAEQISDSLENDILLEGPSTQAVWRRAGVVSTFAPCCLVKG